MSTTKKLVIVLAVFLACVGLGVTFMGEAKQDPVEHTMKAYVLTKAGDGRESDVVIRGTFMDFLPFQGDDHLSFEGPGEGIFLKGNKMPLDRIIFDGKAAYTSVESGANEVFIKKDGRFICVMFEGGNSMLVAPARNKTEAKAQLQKFLGDNPKMHVSKVEAITDYIE